MIDALMTRALRLPAATSPYTIERGVRIPVRDGVELAADLYRPRDGALGSVLVRGPYGRGGMYGTALARPYAARGYNVLFVSSRGTFGSGGSFDPMITESDDGQDVVRWMREQPWFTGSFATAGGSYLGHTQWALLDDPPEDLAAAVIAVGPHDFRKHAWGAGAFKLDFLGWTYSIVHQEDHGSLATQLRAPSYARRIRPHLNDLPLTRPADTLLDGRAPWYPEWVRRSEPDDPFWEPMRHADALERASIPVLLHSGWQDAFLPQTIEQYERLHDRGVDVAMTIGPWSHLSMVRGMSMTMRETLDWLDEHLAKRAPRRRASAVRVCVTGADEWSDLPSWPPPGATTECLHLGPGGALSTVAQRTDSTAGFTFDPADPTPTVGGPLFVPRCVVDDTDLAARADVLSYTGPVLDRPMQMMGRPVVELAHTSDNPYADLFVRVSEVDGKGRSRNVTEGYLRLDPERAPGPVQVPLRDAAHRFAAGSRVRLLIAGGSHPQYARNLGTGGNPGTGVTMRSCRHEINHLGSRLLIPKV
jgi:uncharacterized protein